MFCTMTSRCLGSSAESVRERGGLSFSDLESTPKRRTDLLRGCEASFFAPPPSPPRGESIVCFSSCVRVTVSKNEMRATRPDGREEEEEEEEELVVVVGVGGVGGPVRGTTRGEAPIAPLARPGDLLPVLAGEEGVRFGSSPEAGGDGEMEDDWGGTGKVVVDDAGIGAGEVEEEEEMEVVVVATEEEEDEGEVGEEAFVSAEMVAARRGDVGMRDIRGETIAGPPPPPAGGSAFFKERPVGAAGSGFEGGDGGRSMP